MPRVVARAQRGNEGTGLDDVPRGENAVPGSGASHALDPGRRMRWIRGVACAPRRLLPLERRKTQQDSTRCVSFQSFKRNPPVCLAVVLGSGKRRGPELCRRPQPKTETTARGRAGLY